MTFTLDIDNISLLYGKKEALSGVSFQLKPGRIYGLLGRNGSGKSSLLSLLAAFRKPTTGEVRVNGEPLFENEKYTGQIALIREGGDTVEESENATEAFRFASYLRPGWDRAYALELAERLQIPMKTSLDKLSRGQRSAVGIVLGLAANTPITMFDETYLGLDAPTRYAFYDALLDDYMRTQRTFVLSTHLIEEVSKLFEDVLILDRGRLMLQESAETMRARGVAVTGPSEAVDRHIQGRNVIGSKSLGNTKSVMIYGTYEPEQIAMAEANGLQLEPIAMQDLFVHLTSREGFAR